MYLLVLIVINCDKLIHLKIYNIAVIVVMNADESNIFKRINIKEKSSFKIYVETNDCV